MGVVHLAQAGDGSRVALKVLRPHIVGDDEAARAAGPRGGLAAPGDAARASPRSSTPTRGARRRSSATRYVPGLSLHEHVRQEGPVRGDDLRHFATGLAEAVIAVHQVGVLHRDIKPSNVLLEGRSPVLIDFGLARLAEDPRLTQTGWLLGTPGYLAPEILYGDDATTASDVHSWAATVVFAATGRPPFGTGPAMAIMDRVRRGEHDLSERAAGAAPAGARRAWPPTPPTAPVRRRCSRRCGRRCATTSRCPTCWRRTSGPPPPTTPLTTVEPAPHTRPLTGPSVLQPARAPYMQPPAPQPARDARRAAAAGPAGRWRPAPGGLPRLQRGTLLLGLFAVATLGFAWAPYLALAVACLVALAVRTVSWTTESARQRQHLRGRRRWYDATLTLVSAPGTSWSRPAARSCCCSGRRWSPSWSASPT